MDDYINKFRFFIPPTIFFVLLFIFNPEWFSIITRYLEDNKDNLNVLTPILGGSFMVLAIGYIISSIGTFIINFLGLTATKEYRREKARYFLEDKLLSFFETRDAVKSLAKRELEYWCAFKKEEDNYLRKKIEIKWAMFSASLNAAVSVLLAFIFANLFKYTKNILFEAIFSMVLFLIFYYNAMRSRHTLQVISDEKIDNSNKY